MSVPFIFRQGQSPLVVSFPHQGIAIPESVAQTMSSTGQASIDTDWYVRELYDCLEEIDATVICAHWSRYVVDLNRAPDNQVLYPGRSSTSIVPVQSFAGAPLYRDTVPVAEEIAARVKQYWWPYHEALQKSLEQNTLRYGYALLWDAHSIRGEVPQLFKGRLPELNFGTNNSASAAPALGRALVEYAESRSPYSAVLNGRFTGGYITRHYGNPQQHVHAVQLEMNQQIYLHDELMQPPDIDAQKAAQLAVHLRRMLQLYVATGEQLEHATATGSALDDVQGEADNADN